MLHLVIDEFDMSRIPADKMAEAIGMGKVHNAALKAAQQKGMLKQWWALADKPGNVMLWESGSLEELTMNLASLPANPIVNREVFPLVPSDFIIKELMPRLEEMFKLRPNK